MGELLLIVPALALIVSVVSLIYSVFRNGKADDSKRSDAMTTVIVKLENISDGISEIKSDLRNTKQDVQDLREKVAMLSELTRSAHGRIDKLEGK